MLRAGLRKPLRQSVLPRQHYVRGCVHCGCIQASAVDVALRLRRTVSQRWTRVAVSREKPFQGGASSWATHKAKNASGLVRRPSAGKGSQQLPEQYLTQQAKASLRQGMKLTRTSTKIITSCLVKHNTMHALALRPIATAPTPSVPQTPHTVSLDPAGHSRTCNGANAILYLFLQTIFVLVFAKDFPARRGRPGRRGPRTLIPHSVQCGSDRAVYKAVQGFRTV